MDGLTMVGQSLIAAILLMGLVFFGVSAVLAFFKDFGEKHVSLVTRCMAATIFGIWTWGFIVLVDMQITKIVGMVQA